MDVTAHGAERSAHGAQRSAKHAVAAIWDALGGAESALDRWQVNPGDTGLDSPLPVADLALGSVGAAALAAAELAVRRGIDQPQPAIDAGGVGAAFTSERFLRRDGERFAGFAPLSGFFAARDGWVRTHANYDHHRLCLLRALDLPEHADALLLAARIGALDAVEIERRVYDGGGLAVAVRTPEQWAASDAGMALAEHPLLRLQRAGGAPPVPLPELGDPRPAAGVRVLDLTRVIAGPIATRTLAHLGADVLRVDSPGSPEIAFQHIDTGFGKRSTLLDLAEPSDRARFEELLASADVVVRGYRPGSLAAYGLDVAAIHARHPRVIIATLSAWGTSGPWSTRRGFDSLVQAATGIAELCRSAPAEPSDGPPAGPPGVLPAQALDHATGYLIAAAVLRALAERAQHGGSWSIDASLAQTATWLLGRPQAVPAQADEDGQRRPDATPWLRETPSDYGVLRYVVPPVRLTGVPDTWSHGPVIWGTSAARWA